MPQKPEPPQNGYALLRTDRWTRAILSGYACKCKHSRLQKTWLHHIRYMQADMPMTSAASTCGFLPMNRSDTGQRPVCPLSDGRTPLLASVPHKCPEFSGCSRQHPCWWKHTGFWDSGTHPSNGWAELRHFQCYWDSLHNGRHNNSATRGHEADSRICLPQRKGELTGLLPDATEVQYPVRFQYANGIESLFDKSVHDTAAGIPAVAEKVRNNRRHRQFLCNVLYDFYLGSGFIVHDNDIIQDNPIAGKHSGYSLMPVILFPLRWDWWKYASSIGYRAHDEGFAWRRWYHPQYRTQGFLINNLDNGAF